MTGFPETIIETSFGTLLAWATSAHHVGFRTLDQQYEREATRITINGVEYRMRLDLHSADYFTDKAAWRSYDGGWGLESYNSPILNRDNYADATSAAYEKVRDVLAPELVKFIQSEDGRRMLAEADYARAKADVDAAIEAVEKSRQLLDDAMRRRAAAVDRLTNLEGARSDVEQEESDNVGVKEIAERMGVNSSAVSNWIKRDASFPAPHISLSRSSVWNWPEVKAWAIATGRMTIGGALATGGIPRTQ
jgi:predicted DNA-binding transcriptional regulator AlpA